MVDFFKISMSFTQLLNHCESLREQVQTRLEQVDKNGFETIKNGSKLIRRASEIEALGLLGRGGGGEPPKISDFHRKLAALEARFWGPFWNPFSVHDAIQGRPGRKTDDFGGSGCRVFF